LTFYEWNNIKEALPFNKIITTTSTGILRPKDSSERLQVIDAKEIFEEHLNQKKLKNS
jgi:hypothetical protein